VTEGGGLSRGISQLGLSATSGVCVGAVDAKTSGACVRAVHAKSSEPLRPEPSEASSSRQPSSNGLLDPLLSPSSSSVSACTPQATSTGFAGSVLRPAGSAGRQRSAIGELLGRPSPSGPPLVVENDSLGLSERAILNGLRYSC
jgi:hypothetical protein